MRLLHDGEWFSFLEVSNLEIYDGVEELEESAGLRYDFGAVANVTGLGVFSIAETWHLLRGLGLLN